MSILLVKKIISESILKSIKSCKYDTNIDEKDIKLNETKNKEIGDISTGISFILAKKNKKPPIEIAQNIVKKIDLDKNLIMKTNVSKPGFINFHLNVKTLYDNLFQIIVKNKNYGKSSIGINKKALVEFVSANPTGPLTVGHGRQAVLGDIVSRILEFNGYLVEREYYYNDAGRQMRVLEQSIKSRYIQLFDKESSFPEHGYHGDYIVEIAKNILIKELGFKDFKELDIFLNDLNNQDKKKYLNKTNKINFRNFGEELIFDNIKKTLKRIRINFDNFVNEKQFYDDGSIEKILKIFERKKLSYKKDGAVWLKTSEFGKEVDTVIIKNTGEPTYRLPDIAYHGNKIKREFDLIINILGADHKDTVPDVINGVKALGYEINHIKVLIHQFVSLIVKDEKMKMSTRKANFVTLDDLIDMVGVDISRYFFIMRGKQSHLNFDVDLAKKESDENPVFYLQYAYARICNILKFFNENENIELKKTNFNLLTEKEEINLMKNLNCFDEIIIDSLNTLEPQTIANYLQQLATSFHKFYANHRVINSNKELTNSRIKLILSTKIVLENGLDILGISHPQKM